MYPANHLDVELAIHGLLDNLHATSPSLQHAHTPLHIQHLEDSLDSANDQCNAIAVHFRARIEEATRVLRELEAKATRVDSLRSMVVLAARGRLLLYLRSLLRPPCHRHHHRPFHEVTLPAPLLAHKPVC